MTSGLPTPIRWLLLRIIPTDARETTMGDLIEEGGPDGALNSPRKILIAGLGVALHCHLEPYRDRDARLGLLGLFVTGLGLTWAVKTASGGATPTMDMYGDPLSRMALAVYQASHLTAALASGLLVGHLPWVPKFAAHGRWHVASALATVSFLSAAPHQNGTLAAALLLTATWVGDRARFDADRDGQFAG